MIPSTHRHNPSFNQNSQFKQIGIVGRANEDFLMTESHTPVKSRRVNGGYDWSLKLR